MAATRDVLRSGVDPYTLTSEAMTSFLYRMTSFARSVIERVTGISVVLDRQAMHEKQLVAQAELLQRMVEHAERMQRDMSLLTAELHGVQRHIDEVGQDMRALSAPLQRQLADGLHRFDVLSDALNHVGDAVRQIDTHIESNAAQIGAEQQKLRDDICQLRTRIDSVESATHLVARRSSSGRTRIRCAFLIHNIAAWDALADVVEEMQNHPRFEVFVFSIDRRFPGASGYGGESDVSAQLDLMGVMHRRLGIERTPDGLAVLRSIEPDLIFRQSPWDVDIPDMFSTRNVNFARICYVPYYATVLVKQHETHAENSTDFHTDMEFHRSCWRIFCDSEFHKALFDATSARGSDNVVVSGSPKFDRLLRLGTAHPHWPIGSSEQQRGTRIIWAPHHSVTEDWLGFGTFLSTYEGMLKWARERNGCEFVLKPHPALFDRLQNVDSIDDAALSEFLQAWDALPNTAMVLDGGYAELFAASDCLITDGISFIAEYQLFQKPLIFIDSGHHADFNEIGTSALEGTHKVTDIDGARRVVDALRAGSLRSLSAQQRAFVERHLNAYSGTSARFIVEYLSREIQT